MIEQLYSQRRLIEMLGPATRTVDDMGDGERLAFACSCCAETYGPCAQDEAVWSIWRMCFRHAAALMSVMTTGAAVPFERGSHRWVNVGAPAAKLGLRTHA